MGIKEYIRANEKTYKSKKNVKYLFCKAKNTDKLIVTFPAFSPRGTPPAYYNIITLQHCNCYRLYI